MSPWQTRPRPTWERRSKSAGLLRREAEHLFQDPRGELLVLAGSVGEALAGEVEVPVPELFVIEAEIPHTIDRELPGEGGDEAVDGDDREQLGVPIVPVACQVPLDGAEIAAQRTGTELDIGVDGGAVQRLESCLVAVPVIEQTGALPGGGGRDQRLETVLDD